jgi:peroxiredoxin
MLRGQSVRLLVALGGGAVVVLVVVLGVAMSRGVGDSPIGRTEAAFTEASPFTLPTMDGDGELALEAYAGGPLFVYFWASWCLPCEQEAPVIQRLWPEYEALGYTFVAVNIWDIGVDARDFVERHQITFPVVRDTGEGIYLDYGVEALPEAFFLRPGLEVQAKYSGALEEDVLRELLDALREES